MAEEGEEGDKGRVPPTTSAMTASRSSRSLLIKPLSKLDHLGLPLSSSNNQKFKYARTCTIIFDQEKARDLKEEKQWVLLKDSKVVMDMSMAGLKRLFSLFKEATRGMGVGESMIGPRAFSLALRQMGLRDPVHIDRLFKNFSHPNQPEKIDFREFMRTLCSVNEEPIEDRLRLLFDVWDVDHSGSLSYSELGIIIVTGVDSGDLDTVTEAFNRVWSEIRSQSQNKEEDWIGPGRAAGISKEDLVESARRPGFVRDFFIQQLTRQAPASKDHSLNFAARLRELEAQIVKEVERDGLKEQEARAAKAAAAAAELKKRRSLGGSKSASSILLGSNSKSKLKLSGGSLSGSPTRLPPISNSKSK